ncbi:MAG: carboxy-S-adenosyl-L-methionine synthase CmoA [Nitrospinota bacterium]
MNKKDTLFSSPMERVKDFDFGNSTAEVFDDMLTRSVPFYEEIQHMIAELAGSLTGENPVIYDLGCSTGTTMLMLGTMLKRKSPVLIGVDNSEAMLKKAGEKLRQAGIENQARLENLDLNQGILFQPADLFILNLTLQFVRPLYRDGLLENIFKSLKSGGGILIVEKVLVESSRMNRVYVQHYHDFKKRKGYSDLEISQKREGLENILVPYRVSENLELLKKTGFTTTDLFFKWYNFAGFIGVKTE